MAGRGEASEGGGRVKTDRITGDDCGFGSLEAN
jgi:hypothetical protein